MSATTSMTDAEIASRMGWKGPGSYSATAMRKVRALMDAAVADEGEACAKVCDAIRAHLSKDRHWEKAIGPLETAAEAIRGRRKQ